MLLSAPPLLHRPPRNTLLDDVDRPVAGAGRAPERPRRRGPGPRRSHRLPRNVESTIFEPPAPRRRSRHRRRRRTAGRWSRRARASGAGRPAAGSPGRRSATSSSAASGRRCPGRGSGACRRRRASPARRRRCTTRRDSLTTFAVLPHPDRHRVGPAVEGDHAARADRPHHRGRRTARRRPAARPRGPGRRCRRPAPPRGTGTGSHAAPAGVRRRRRQPDQRRDGHRTVSRTRVIRRC